MQDKNNLIKKSSICLYTKDPQNTFLGETLHNRKMQNEGNTENQKATSRKYWAIQNIPFQINLNMEDIIYIWKA